MVFWFLILLQLLTVGESQLIAVGESQLTSQVNQTDLQTAMADMRAKSYHGFVILLKILTTSVNVTLETRDLTFLMPSDEELSDTALTAGHLDDFLLSHSIPTALTINHLLHFPTGTLIPTSLPNTMITFVNNGKFGVYANNARIVNPNVCVNSQMRCHGISGAIKFDRTYKQAISAVEIIDQPDRTSEAQSPAPAQVTGAPAPSPSLTAQRRS